MFIVRNERFGTIAMFALISDAWAERNRLVKATNRHYTVSYLLKK
jgi:hypothetical protein